MCWRGCAASIAWNGRTIALAVEAGDTVRDVKTRLLKVDGIHPYACSLRFKGNELDDDRTLSDYNINRACELEYLPLRHHGDHRRPMAFVKIPNGKTVTLMINVEEPVSRVLERLQDLVDIPTDQQRLIDNDGAPIGDRTSWTPLGERRGWFRPIRDGHELEVADMRNLIMLRVDIDRVQTLTLFVTASDAIGHVKAKIENKQGTPRGQQCLSWRGRELADDRSLADCGIVSTTTLSFSNRL